MAKRRCFCVDLFENEKFLMLNDKSKVLYFGLMLHSDDDGVIINPTAIMRLLKKQKKYFDELTEKLRKIGMDDDSIKASMKEWMKEIK